MSRSNPMAAKTAKARRMDIAEFKYIQSRGDAADYLAGREVRVYDHLSSRSEIDRREHFVRERRMLTPMEDWCVRRGYATNPFLHGRQANIQWTPVYYADGQKLMIRRREDALAMLERGEVVKVWDSVEKRYLSR